MESAVGPCGVAVFHVPSVFQPLFRPPSSTAQPYTFFTPANGGVKLSATLTDSVFPDPLIDDAPASSVHWLLLCVPATPGVSGPSHVVPASLYRYRRLVVCRYRTRHPFTFVSAAFISP